MQHIFTYLNGYSTSPQKGAERVKTLSVQFVPKEPDLKSVRVIFKQNSVLGFKSLLPRPLLDRLPASPSLQKPHCACWAVPRWCSSQFWKIGGECSLLHDSSLKATKQEDKKQHPGPCLMRCASWPVLMSSASWLALGGLRGHRQL